ncbi:VPS10 domain-containing receptor SorCS3 [Trematomus bernacchii]|uniref:VPS10 domain-containing receptor SorCS3 n=1 Tax=Trematomus bernacchii TaxID=40690 RepID=UPI00146D95F7|nr:VPS10 domain-containing receptor SorCS3 [Trematomus bernacchii]XP_034008057.1 VPS10 domain-containing receptor SorCS3 [Trematomus bernacchii]
MGLWSFWSVSLCACVFLNPFHSKFVAQAEISSLKTNDRFYRLEVNQLEALVTRESTEVKVDSSTKVLSAFQSREVDALKANDGKQVEKETQRGLENEALIGNKTARNCLTSPTIPGKKCNNISEDNQGRPTANIVIENSFPDTRNRVKRGLITPYAENVDRSIHGEAQSTERFVETVQGVSSSRPEHRRTGDEGRGSNPRQSEPHLDTSTFALSGDSAHNQAMVHWSGHNSSVILILTKLYDFNLGAVTESSLWRSSDYGSTYSKLNDKVGSRTVLSYLYVCPTNKQKIMMLSDPEVESAVLISSDEGASFEKYPINFNILSLLFHPAQENWILAYSHDGKLYSSMDFGRKWQLVHDNVMPGRFYWAVMGLDRESDVVHIETRIAKGRAQYVKCRAQRCTEGNKLYLFPGYVDTNSMVVQDEYVFTQVTKSGRASYFVSFMRESFKRMKLPKYCLPKDMHIISTDEKQVFAAVQEWNQNNTYSLYISDSPGVYFTLSLENLRTSRGPAGNLLVDFYKVEGINGMYLANKLLDSHVKTFITYNKGQTWALLPAPAADVAGNNLHCILPFCSLHLHLEMSENPYTSGPITSKKSVPGIIVATGNIGTELSSTNLGMFITSDAGNSWRQIFDEEHNVWFLDNGGALLAVLHSPTPIRHLWISLDEGKKWDRHSFSLAPLYVDGVLMEPESDNHIITFFGHFSHRSEWQLIKIDYKGLFSRRCMDGDYQTWQLHNKGELCVMGEKQIYMKRRPGNRCMLAQDYSRIYSSEPCLCTAYDFECDYGWERQTNGKCSPAFWFNPNGVAKSCSTSQSFLNSTGYRKVLSNNCKEAGRNVYSPKRQACRPRPPRGLRLSTSHGELSSTVGSNVTFMLYLEDGDSLRTSIQLDFGDGIKIIYSNLSRTDDGISHIYRATGIYRVTAMAENSQGSDSSILFLHITSPVERVYLSAPIVAIRGKEVNLTAVVWPSHTRTLTFFWWFHNSSEPIITLEGSVSYTFQKGGNNKVTVQVASGSIILQDSKVLTVKEFFRSLLLSFSPALDEHNPDIPEWREDIGRVVRSALSQVSGVSEDQLLVSLYPGLPSTAELFILPDEHTSTENRKGGEEALDRISDIFVTALNQGLIQFELKADICIVVYMTQQTLAPLVDSNSIHSGSAMLLLLTVVLVGLGAFFIYKFKRKIPWIHVQTEDSREKDPEVISTVGQNDNMSKVKLSEFPSPKELMEKELEARSSGGIGRNMERIVTREFPNCTNV